MEIRMPSSCAVIEEQEMTYLDGGSGSTALDLVLNFIPGYAWITGMMDVRDYRQKHPNNWIETGSNALSEHMNSGILPFICDLQRIVNCISTAFLVLPLAVDALIVFA